jgi:hypothetical protein
MTTSRAAVLLAALAGACGRRQQEGPPVRPPPAAVAPTVVAEDVPAAASPDDVPVAVDAPSADAALLRSLADGSVDLAAHVDPAHGVVLVTYVEAPPSGEGRERHETRRLCGAAVGRDAALRARLRGAAERAGAEGGFLCDGDECLVPGMEYQPSYRLRLGRRADGARVLLGAIEMSEAAMGEQWLAPARAYVERAMTAARARACAGR